MNLKETNQTEICNKCQSKVEANVRHCITCENDIGPPNVRAANNENNIDKLEARYKRAKQLAFENDYLKVFEKYSDEIEKKSGVIISMPPSVLRRLLSDPNEIYQNYENLVASGDRRPAMINNDTHRSGVTGILFGSYGKKIRYGVLSLNDYGLLSSYGKAHCRLRSIVVKDRTTFLETNSYKFIEAENLKPSDGIPLGYISNWNNRHKLALAKTSKALNKTTSETDFSNLVINSSGKDRNEDEFIEAHIYGSFDGNAIESIRIEDKNVLSREEKFNEL